MLTAATTLHPAPPWPQRELAVPGECTFAGRMPEKLKAALRAELEKERGRLLKPNARPDRVLEFAFLYNLVVLAVDAETLTGLLNLAGAEPVFRATLTLGEGRLAGPVAGAAQALAEPLAIALPAAFGGMPLAKPPAEPLYLVQADGREIHVAASRLALEQLVAWMIADVGDAQTRSALNLREIGKAAFLYRDDHDGAWPATIAVLGPYLADPSVLVNPARADPGAPGSGGDYQLVPLTNEAAAGQPWAKVLAFEIFPPERTAAEGLLVLFADGHVDRLGITEFNLLYQQTLRSLGR
jgi:hypothetical protein